MFFQSHKRFFMLCEFRKNDEKIVYMRICICDVVFKVIVLAERPPPIRRRATHNYIILLIHYVCVVNKFNSIQFTCVTSHYTNHCFVCWRIQCEQSGNTNTSLYHNNMQHLPHNLLSKILLRINIPTTVEIIATARIILIFAQLYV